MNGLPCAKRRLLAYASEHGPSVVDIEVLILDDETAAFFAQTAEAVWLDTLREVMDGNEPFVWVQRMKSIDTLHQKENNALVESVLGQVDSWSSEEWKQVLQDVYHHVRTARYLDPLTEQDIYELREDVSKLLLNELPTGMR